MELTIFTLIVLLFSIIIHELAHGSVALYLGDPTAKVRGRLTLNPLKHLDPFGSIVLPLLMLLITFGRGPVFGWAKPVPINPNNFRDKRWGSLKVAAAGPAVNFFVAIIFALLIRFLNLPDSFFLFFSIIAIYNFLWGIFNLLPLPPFDGSWILFSLLPEKWQGVRVFLQEYGLIIILFIIFFGLGLLAKAAEFLFYLVSGQPFLF